MNLLRLLIIVAIVWLIIHLYRSSRQRSLMRHDPPPTQPVERNMVRCGHCGIHLPREEALADEESYYCSEEHRQLGPGKHDE